MKDRKIITNLSEFGRLNLLQIRFFLDKQREYNALAKKQQELDEKQHKRR